MIKRFLRLGVALPLLSAGMFAASSASHLGPAAPLCAQAGSEHRAGLVIEHGDGQVIRRCVGFNSPTATALAILQASGIEVGIASYGGGLGAAVCQIDNEPPTYPPGCFTASGSYWVLFVAKAGGAWVNSDLGASSVNVSDGDDVGFRYDSQTGADPPPPSPAGTCPVVTPPPTRTPAPTARSTATPRVSSDTPSTASAHAVTLAPTMTPEAGVLGITTPAATIAPIASMRSSDNPSGLNLGLLLAAIGAGALVGLLATRIRRRRRA
jgi:hypothetical protein